jgi:hypothetical protein
LEQTQQRKQRGEKKKNRTKKERRMKTYVPDKKTGGYAKDEAETEKNRNQLLRGEMKAFGYRIIE